MKQAFHGVREALGDGPGPARRALQRARLLGGTPTPRVRPWRGLPVLGAAAATAVALVLWFALRDHEEVRVGEELRAGAAPRVVEFARGSRVTLEPGSVAHLDTLDDERVRMVLSSGRFAAEVTKNTGRVWQYEAGPWVVRVVGTRLQVSWSPAAQTLEVSVSEGAVEVQRAGEPPTLVRAGEKLVRAPAEAGALAPPSPTPPPALPVLPAPPRVAKPVLLPPEPIEVRDDEPAPQALALSWQQLMAAGRRREALDQAEREGVLRQLPVVRNDDALLLADAARLERRVGVARELLSHVVARGGPEAAEAAFLLGRLEAEAQASDAARAAFRRSLELDPFGAFSEQSRGRLLELLLEQQDLPAARIVASEYLSHHPSGAWANLARRVAAP